MTPQITTKNWEMMMVSGGQFDVFSMVDKLGCYPFGSVLLSYYSGETRNATSSELLIIFDYPTTHQLASQIFDYWMGIRYPFADKSSQLQLGRIIPPIKGRLRRLRRSLGEWSCPLWSYSPWSCRPTKKNVVWRTPKQPKASN